MAKAKLKTKAEELQEAIAKAVGAGRELHLESVDFSDPNRPKTCLEVDLPLLNINHIAGPEMSSGAAKKPIYTWQKWWARRSSAVFRAMLLAAATKAPEDQGEAAKLVWDSYYGNHQKNVSVRRKTFLERLLALWFFGTTRRFGDAEQAERKSRSEVAGDCFGASG